MSKTPAPDFSLLLASSVHDIKNSLGMLLETLDQVIAQTDLQDPEQRQRFVVLQGESTRINNTLISLLGLYRLGQDQIKVQPHQVYVRDFLEEQVAAQQLLLDMRSLRTEIDCDADLTGWFDSRLIEGVISNILVNAARYAKSVIRLRATRENGGLIMEISDDGPGYPTKLLKKAANHSIDFSTGSTNLGLYFAEVIAELHRNGEHQGRIQLSNRSDGGSCFQLHLP